MGIVNNKERTMSNYPNMSYCMNNNTLAGLGQILDTMDEDGDLDFLRDLSRDERRAFEELAQVCEQFCRRAERVMDRELEAIESRRG
jgi:hypothetical protein